MKWTTPTRMVGTRPLTIIPNEVYLEIFDYVTHSLDLTCRERSTMLSNLALVCRFFCAIAVPRIFESLCVTGTATKTDGSPSNKVTFCRDVSQGKEPAASLASHVINFSFRSWRKGGDHPWAITGFLNMYGRALRRMPNLQSLVLWDVDLDKHFLKVICALKTLTSLTLNITSFCDDLTDAPNTPPLSLKKLVVRCTSLTSPLPDHADIIAAIVKADKLEHLFSSDWSVAKAIFTRMEDSNLVRLDVFEADWGPELRNALGKCRLLKTLQIAKLNVFEESIPVLPASSIPDLQNLQCPPSMLAVVAALRLQHSSHAGRAAPMITMSEVALLKQSTAEISELRIPSHFFFLAPVSEHFPCVKELYIDCAHPNYGMEDIKDRVGFNEFIRKLVTKWPPAPSVRCLRLALVCVVPWLSQLNYFADLELQREVLPELEHAFPNLRCVQLVHIVEWRREAQGDRWAGHVPLRRHENVRQLLQAAPQTEVKDVDGIFAPFLEACWPPLA
ncbi:hypothetical protein FPV67DRAFT_1507945 [Lyophyllum atratum]|nr:hypothetical protein FPV67DRAFT_1507945 [Lyophyllum atratum]